uniref:NADH-ubiquinone oxidoreductase chain 6 n=1 Tax=Choreocolax polysiphoniae TaxID=282351 RepID=A0A1J0F7B8_9FLOR|nr:NADH dehydrogenase subunit 6 [Choreocolax polysiphoniae]APC24876.1 NADH dehydrogenase subunit 6 [Choreocolax polysiphoniae]
MFLEIFLFNIFYFFILFSMLFVSFSENAVYSLLFLVLTFCNVTFLLLLLGAEFISFLFLIIYVGAISVLFLFIIMMLNIKNTNYLQISNYLYYYIPIFLFLFLFLINYFFKFLYLFDSLKFFDIKLILINWLQEINFTTNIKIVGNVLYTNYSILFIIMSFLLLVSMIGVIVLTLHQKTILLLKKQEINFQLTRNFKNTIKFIKIRKN